MEKLPSSYNKYFKDELYKTLQESTGSETLDKAFKLPLTGYTLIRKENKTDITAGATAICLEIAEKQTQLGRKVIYYDPSDSIFLHRVKGIDSNNFKYIRPTSALDILQEAQSDPCPGAIHILDSINYLKDGFDVDKYTEGFAKAIKRVDPSATIICTQDAKKSYGSLWGTIVTISIDTRRVVNSIPLGHLARIKGPLGVVETYIEYKGGRISKGYEIASKSEELGLTKNSVFIEGDVRVQGFWKFIEEYDSLINNSK